LVSETVRMLGLSSHEFSRELLLQVAGDGRRRLEVRADAMAGLGRHASRPEVAKALRGWFASGEAVLKSESLRSLKGSLGSDAESHELLLSVAKVLETVSAKADRRRPSTAGHNDMLDWLATSLKSAGRPVPMSLKRIAGSRPTSVAGWAAVLGSGGSPEAGRRLFFHSAGPQCARCHMVNGRGRRVGTDLSLIARTKNRRGLLESILLPSREVAPQFTSWTLVTVDGRVLEGVIVYENRDRLTIEDSAGKQTNLANTEVELRMPRRTSLMPEKLIDRLAISELRDLLAFLETLK